MRRIAPLLLLFGCATDPKPAPSWMPEDSGEGEGESETGPTWYGGVGHLVTEDCGTCHRAGGLAENLSFEDPEMASNLSAAIAAVTASRQMPPFTAETSDECPNPWGWLHDPRLSDDEIALLAEWDTTGAAIGSPDNANPIPPPPSLNLSGAEDPVFPLGGWTTEPIGAVQDEFICFSIDPEVDGDRWLNGVQVVPDNGLVVHHVLVGLDRAGTSAALADDSGVYPCFGGFGDLSDVGFVGAWVPGAAPIELPEYSAMNVSEDARFVLQMHYHRAATAETDSTGLALRFTEQLPVRQASIGLVGNFGSQNSDGSGLQPGPEDPSSGPGFLIPAGSSDHTETMYAPMFGTLTRPQEVFLAGNHMHYIGTDMRTWVERGDSTPTEDDACLVHTPAWDFDWQQFFQFDLSAGPGPVIYPGDELWLQCRFDNTLSNPALVNALTESGLSEPIDVGLGEGSLDEMCIAIVGTVPLMQFEVDDETHSGQVHATISSTAFGFEQACVGPASARIEADGTTSAIAACGLNVLGNLYTIELAVDGTTASDGTVTGALTLTAMEVADTVEGTVSGPTDGIDISASGILAGGDIAITGKLEF